MALLPPRPRYALLGLAVALRMIPLTAVWLTRFVVFAELGLIDTLAALVAPAWMGSSPFFILIFYWAFRRMPRALVDAARLDGLGAFGVWARIAMPLARPATVAVGVLAFVQYWSDFINPLLYLKTDARYTLAVGLRALQQMDVTNWPLHLAAAVVMMGPVVLLFFLAQRAFWMPDRAAGGARR
jgi:multiple sugar transport system permease protein